MRLSSTGDVGAFVRAERRAQGLSQEDLAIAAGVSRRWIVSLEQGKPGSALGMVLRVLNALGVVLDATVSPVTQADKGAIADGAGVGATGRPVVIADGTAAALAAMPTSVISDEVMAKLSKAFSVPVISDETLEAIRRVQARPPAPAADGAESGEDAG